MAVSNDIAILDSFLSAEKERFPNKSDDDLFETFSANLVNKNNELSDDEIELGILGGGGDGGIDSIYVFLNGSLVGEIEDIPSIPRSASIDIYIIQSKRSPKFQEAALDRLSFSADYLFDLSGSSAHGSYPFSEALGQKAALVRELITKAAPRFPRTFVRYHYCSKGDAVSDGVAAKAGALKSKVEDLVHSAEVEVHFWGARKLLEIARAQPQTTFELLAAENPMSAGYDIGYVCLVNVKEYFKFIRRGDGSIRMEIFESNVRDYQNRTAVNDQIQATLVEKSKDDFWWLNNGISIVCDKVTPSGKRMIVENPQIVNGLQTSMEIFRYLSVDPSVEEDRHVLVRIIAPAGEAASADRIIRATNSQTQVSHASLRATDGIHRDIEDYLKSSGYFYERRKNYYKNLGRPADKIISITYLAQAVMAVLLGRPNDARARPSSLIKKDSDYSTVFDKSLDLAVFLNCVEVMKAVENLLRGKSDAFKVADRNNVKFHIAMYYAYLLLGTRPTPTLMKTAISQDDEKLDDAYAAVLQSFLDKGASDAVAKGPDFVTQLKDDAEMAVLI